MRISGFDHSSSKAGMSEATSGPPIFTSPTRASDQTINDPTESGDATQLSKLSSVLNGLEHGASAMRRHVQQAMGAVRGGTYQVDPMQLSKRIVGEALGSA
jgi:hypothetical protein